MNSKNFFIILLFIMAIVINCENAPLDVAELGIRVTKITFGTSWDAVNCVPEDTGRVFSGPISVVYYEICFKEIFTSGGMIKKAWRRDSGKFLEATSFISKETKRICGEIHKYEVNQTMDLGEYQISVWWYSSGERRYVQYDYDDGVNRSFKIE